MSSEPAGADTDATSDLHEFTVVWNQLDEFAASLAEIRAELHDLKRSPDDVEAVNDSVDTLEQRIDQLDDRMSLLELVDTSDDLEPKQRSGVLIEHLRRKARRRGDRDNNEPSKATMDREAAEDALHYPDLDRTTFY